MIPYIITFVSSVALLYASQKTQKSSYRKLLIAIALFLPCVLAGARAMGVGTDTRVYLKPIFDAAKSSNNFSDFLEYPIHGIRYVKNYEIGFTFLTYITTIIFKNIHILMFIIEAMIIFPVYFGCKKIKQLENKTWLCMLVYYLLFFNVGLNAMREFICLSIIFYGICIILAERKHRLLKYLLLTAIAFAFHKSALLSVSVVSIFYILSPNKTSYIKYNHIRISTNVIKTSLIIASALIILLNISILNNFFYSIDGFERYVAYYNGNLSLSLQYIVKVLPLLLITILLSKKFRNKNEDSLFFLTIFCFSSIIFGLLSTTSSYGGRISNTYKIFDTIYLPLLSISPTSNRNKKIVAGTIIAYTLFYWWFTFASRGYNETIPYILGI